MVTFACSCFAAVEFSDVIKLEKFIYTFYFISKMERYSSSTRLTP